MMEVQDTVIKLFGKKITLPENRKMIVASREPTAAIHHENLSSTHDSVLIKMNNKTCLAAKKVDRVGEEEAQKDQNQQISKDDESDTSNSEKKTLKKPDKILPCPRCNSMDTKFCYYNNYNINQPRHFCKSCQRYWTSGGTTRNVPVGSGRRKNKNHSAQYFLHNHTHTTNFSDEETLEVARINGNILGPNFKPKGSVLSFDSASPLCNSVASVFSLAEKRALNGKQNGNEILIASSVTSSDPGARKEIQDPRVQNIHGFPSQFPYVSGVPWPYYPWNSTPPVSGIQNPVYPTPYWNSNVPGVWSYPWLCPKSTLNQTPLINSGSSSSPALGKHSRDGDLLMKEETCERPNLVSQIFTIDGADDATKSSTCRGGLFKGFQAKSGGKKHIIEADSPVLQANPAAMCRSLNFKERA